MNQVEFVTKSYTVRSGKLGGRLRVIFLADLHGKEHGEGNRHLIAEITRLHPDLILSGGDLVTGREDFPVEPVLDTIGRVREIAPVYAVNGNHETKLRHFKDVYRHYVRELKKRGIILVNNHSEMFRRGDDSLLITGCELPLRKYRKLRKQYLSDGEMNRAVGEPRGTDAFHILLAHNPEFGDAYFRWGADLTLSGHFHGGVMRLSENKVAVSPYGIPLPKYGYGRYDQDEKCMIVAGGLGDHTRLVRIHNPMELVCIDLMPLH